MRSGKYTPQLKDNARYQAFVPSLLPFTLKSDPVLEDLLSRANLALGRLDGIAEVVPDVNFFILMYVRKEATLSSQVEGTQATFADVLKAEARVEDIEIHKDVDEILNYIDAMNHGLERLKSFPLSLRLIREIHKKLLRGVRGEHKTPGEFRRSQNWVGGPTIETASYLPPPHHELDLLLDNFEKFMHDNSPMPVLIKIGLLHSQFENIHPFLDGNGRIGRLLNTFYLCQQGALKKPLLYLSQFFKANRREYYDKLNAVYEHDDIEGWLKFFLTGVAQTANSAVTTARKIVALRERDLARVGSFGRSAERGLKLLQFLYKTPMVRISDIENATKLENPNALTLARKFVTAKILKEITGRRRNRVYAYREYIDLFD
ncbi:MAG: Fic family protein [candidate division Zixibacteria bacterium]|nr:Fic family protein [candidate division Zixibacteria bacterium]